MRTRISYFIVIVTLPALVLTAWSFFRNEASEISQTTSPRSLGSPPASAPAFYGSGLGTDGLYNIPLGGSMYNPPYRVRVSWRFSAGHTGLLKSVRPYLMFVSGSGGNPGHYSSGRGGTVLVQLQTDDGTANHFPSGTVLAESLNTAPKAGGILPFAIFPPPLPPLQAGALYHLVFSNTSPDPYNNFVSLNHLGLDARAPVVPRQPSVSDTDLHTLVSENGTVWSDARFINDTPVFDLAYVDGFHQGHGYIEVWSDQTISGTYQTRETFTVRGPSRTVSAVSLRAARISGSDPLTIRLETATGILVEEGAIPASSFPLGPLGPAGTKPSAWVSHSFTKPRTLISGQSYHLVQIAPATSVYTVLPMRKAAEDGLAPATYFADGHAQQKNGAGWGDVIPKSWGTPRPDGDLQFYFTISR